MRTFSISIIRIDPLILSVWGVLTLILPFSSIAQNWTEPVTIYGNGVNVNPSFTIDKNGIIHCVWSHEIETDFHKLYYSKSGDNGLTWSVPEDIVLNNGLRLDEPQIVSDSNNILYVSYSYDVASIPYTMIYLIIFDGISWGEPIVISEGYPGSWGSRLIVDNETKLYCFWHHPSNGGSICYRVMENNTWSQVYQVFSGSNDYFYFVQPLLIQLIPCTALGYIITKAKVSPIRKQYISNMRITIGVTLQKSVHYLNILD